MDSRGTWTRAGLPLREIAQAGPQCRHLRVPLGHRRFRCRGAGSVSALPASSGCPAVWPAGVGSAALPGSRSEVLPARCHGTGQVQAPPPLQLEDEAVLDGARGQADWEGGAPEAADAAQEPLKPSPGRGQGGREANSNSGEDRAMSREEIAGEVARRRNFAIISHPDAGKTTLVTTPGPQIQADSSWAPDPS